LTFLNVVVRYSSHFLNKPEQRQNKLYFVMLPQNILKYGWMFPLKCSYKEGTSFGIWLLVRPHWRSTEKRPIN